MGGAPGEGVGGRELGGAPGRGLGCRGLSRGPWMERLEAGHRRWNWDGGDLTCIWRSKREGGDSGSDSFQNPSSVATPLWSLLAPLAEPLLPALRFLRLVFSLSCSHYLVAGSFCTCCGPVAEWEGAPWRGPGLPLQTGSHLKRVFSHLSDCVPGLLPRQFGSSERTESCESVVGSAL